MTGVDITTVKELLGHKTLTMTLRYSHLAPSHKVKAVDILDNTLNDRPTIQKLYNRQVVNQWELRNSLKNIMGDAGIEPAASSV